jgi:hypothetical protein
VSVEHLVDLGPRGFRPNVQAPAGMVVCLLVVRDGGRVGKKWAPNLITSNLKPELCYNRMVGCCHGAIVYFK